MNELIYYLLITLGINWVMFIPAFRHKTDKLTDMSYSISFIAAIWIAYYLNQTRTNLLLAFLITIWAVRLGAFLFIRIQNMKRDKRFDGIRESYKRFLKFFMLQGFSVWAILIPSFLFMTVGGEFNSVGALIWIFGFVFETMADKQKYDFNKIKTNKDKFITTGLWKYSRHPNYFGEILIWIGIYVYCLPSLTPMNKILGLISPILIISLLVFLTGLPPLEKKADQKWGKLKTYREYKRKTNELIPWIPKK